MGLYLVEHKIRGMKKPTTDVTGLDCFSLYGLASIGMQALENYCFLPPT